MESWVVETQHPRRPRGNKDTSKPLLPIARGPRQALFPRFANPPHRGQLPHPQECSNRARTSRVGRAHRAPPSASLLPRPKSHKVRLARPSCQRHPQSSVQVSLPYLAITASSSTPTDGVAPVLRFCSKRPSECSRITIGDLAAYSAVRECGQLVTPSTTLLVQYTDMPGSELEEAAGPPPN